MVRTPTLVNGIGQGYEVHHVLGGNCAPFFLSYLEEGAIWQRPEFWPLAYRQDVAAAATQLPGDDSRIHLIQ